jgi:tetratricopeptide (TPR) repeat protein
MGFNKSVARFEDAKVKEDLQRLGIESFSTILSLQVASDEGVRKAAGKGRVNEDLFPVLEYEAPKAFFLGQVSQFLVPYDERRSPRSNSPIYFIDYLKRNSLSVKETRDIANYHLTYSSLTPLGLAERFVDLWLQQAPKDADAHWTLARIEEGRGNREGARKELQYLLKVDPTRQDYLEAAARLEFQVYLNERSMLNHKTPEIALAYLHRLLDLKGSKKDRVYRDIAHVHVSNRDYKSAISYLEKAAAYAERNKAEFQADSLWLEAADLALEDGDTRTAIAHARRALAVNPQNSAAKNKLSQLSRLTDVGP